MAKYKAIITQRDGTRICLDLCCREYHAQKLNYILNGESKKIFRFVRLDKPNNLYYGKRRFVFFLLKGVKNANRF